MLSVALYSVPCRVCTVVCHLTGLATLVWKRTMLRSFTCSSKQCRRPWRASSTFPASRQGGCCCTMWDAALRPGSILCVVCEKPPLGPLPPSPSPPFSPPHACPWCPSPPLLPFYLQPDVVVSAVCAAVGAMADGDAVVFDRLAAPASPLIVALLAGAAPQSRNVSLPSPDLVDQCVETLSRSKDTLLRGEEDGCCVGEFW